MPIGRRRQFTEQQWDLMGKVLTKASSNVTYTINKMPRVDLPPDIASKFPSLVQWWEQYNEMMEKWREELNKTLYG